MRKRIAIQYSPSPLEKGLGVEVRNTALEQERWFERDFIPSGFFHDLRDGFNPDELWDLVQGVTIRQMYNALTPQANRMCNYIDVLLSQNTGLNFGDLNNLYFENTDRTLGCNF